MPIIKKKMPIMLLIIKSQTLEITQYTPTEEWINKVVLLSSIKNKRVIHKQECGLV